METGTQKAGVFVLFPVPYSLSPVLVTLYPKSVLGVADSKRVRIWCNIELVNQG